MNRMLRSLLACAGALALATGGPARAGVVMNATRYI